ncbi:hypothetical protein GCM10027341_10580 [Spirosoma knui]
MKTYLLVLAFVSLSVLTASAQDDQKLRNDRTYSTHNYKHPNKAATARQWENQKGVAVRAPGYSQGQVANYKRQVPNAVPTGGIEVNHTPEQDVTLRNYKMQRVSLPKSTTPPASEGTDQTPGQPTAEGN